MRHSQTYWHFHGMIFNIYDGLFALYVLLLMLKVYKLEFHFIFTMFLCINHDDSFTDCSKPIPNSPQSCIRSCSVIG